MNRDEDQAFPRRYVPGMTVHDVFLLTAMHAQIAAGRANTDQIVKASREVADELMKKRIKHEDS